VTRTRASAKVAGSRMETLVAAYLAEHVDDRIERRVANGAKDRGDVSGVRTFRGGRVVVECKDVVRTNLGRWIGEAHDEMGNDDAVAGVVAHKRHGVGAPGEQWITMTLADFAAILTGERPTDSTMPRQPPQ
jgi:hypothetical protein